jgi:Fe-S-cluster containining protein
VITPSDLEAELRAIYESLPRIDCRRLCQGSCGPIVMSDLEWNGLTSEQGERACSDDLVCPYLERSSGLCGAYEVRPLICRLWGVTERLRCEFGCEPERVLTDIEVEALVARVQALSGEAPSIAPVRSVWRGWTPYLEAAREAVAATTAACAPGEPAGQAPADPTWR